MPQQPAELIITNAKVATLDPTGRFVQGVAIAAERFVAVGSATQVEAFAGPATRRVDAGGRLVVPGLIDGHAHLDREGLKDRLPSLAGCGSIDDILDRIAELVRRTPPGQWIVTMPIGEPPYYLGVPDNLREARVPNRHDLDRVAPDHPVYIRPIWGYWRGTLPLVSIANTAALERAGITQRTVPPSTNIQIERELSTGEPTGVFYEFTMKPLVESTLLSMIPRFTHGDRLEGLRQSMRVYNRFGTTSVFEGHGVATEVIAAYQALYQEGALPVRAVLMFSPAWPSHDSAAIKDLLWDWGRWLAGRGLGDEYLRVCGLYTESDDLDDNRLRAQCGPYTGWAGFNFDASLPPDAMIEVMVEAARCGIRVGSIGADTLELFRQVDARVPIGGQRWVLEHVGILDHEQIALVRDLGLVAQAHPGKWIGREGDAHLARLGEDASSSVLPMRALIESGVHVSLATDNVPPSLFHAIAHVVNRRTTSGRRIGDRQAISRLEALACASREGAYLSFEEDCKGTIEVGKLADLTILNEDLLTIDAQLIANIEAVMTVTGGRIVYVSDGTPLVQ